MVQAKQVRYPPTVPADWSPVPTEVQEALDQLAARGSFQVPFTYTSASPIVIGPIDPGTLVYLSQIVIEVAFDDPAATVEFGLGSNPSFFLGPGDVTANFVAQYQNTEALGPAAPDTLILTINPGASTQGSGFLLYGETA